METTVVEMKTEVIGEENHTYEIRRTWEESKGGCLIVELYPTIAIDTTDVACMDLSTMHLLAHLSELGDYGKISVCNLFSMVCANGKPSATSLRMDSKNLSYIEKILDEKKSEDFPVILAWGNSLSKNKTTIEMKKDLLKMLVEKGYEDKTYCLTADEFPEKSEGKHNLFHPLFLGIRVKEGWKISKISIEELFKELSPMGAEVSRGTGAEQTKVSFGETENRRETESENQAENHAEGESENPTENPAEDESANLTENPAEDEKANPTENPTENEAKKSEKKRRKRNDTAKNSTRF